MNRFFFLCLFLLIGGQVLAQQFGTLLVIDYDTGLPVESTAVFQGDRLIGTTNHVGSLQLPEKVKGELTLKHPDYQPLTFKFKSAKDQTTERAITATDAVYEQRKSERSATIYASECANEKTTYLPNLLVQDGTTPLDTYLKAAVRYPARARAAGAEGTVKAKVYVEADGSLSCVVITQSVSFELDDEVYRVLTSMPRWEPAKRGGVPTASVSEVSVEFNPQKYSFNNGK